MSIDLLLHSGERRAPCFSTQALRLADRLLGLNAGLCEVASELTSDPGEVHPEVTDQRPQGILEGSRPILLDDEVAHPRRPVA